MIKAEQRKMVRMELYLAVVKCCEEDHLGSNRVVASTTGEAEQVNHYYPYGSTFYGETTTDHRFKYCGRSALRDAFEITWRKKELDEETGLYYYGARYYDPRLSLWLGTDPMQEKYAGITTYCYTMGSPMIFVDLIGHEPTEEEAARLAAHVYGDKDVTLIGGWKASQL